MSVVLRQCSILYSFQANRLTSPSRIYKNDSRLKPKSNMGSVLSQPFDSCAFCQVNEQLWVKGVILCFRPGYGVLLMDNNGTLLSGFLKKKRKSCHFLGGVTFSASVSAVGVCNSKRHVMCMRKIN